MYKGWEKFDELWVSIDSDKDFVRNAVDAHDDSDDPERGNERAAELAMQVDPVCKEELDWSNVSQKYSEAE